MRLSGLRAWLALVGVCLVAGAVIGGLALALRPTVYASTASTSIMTEPQRADASIVQGLSSAIFMMMPVYAAHAHETDVLEAAAAASGLSAEAVSGQLQVERSIDSSVLRWTFTADDPEEARSALAAATNAFAETLPSQGPHTGEGEPLLAVTTTPATPGAAGSLTPLLGAVAGGAIGLLGGLAAMLLLYRGRLASSADWDEIERVLGMPVAAELVGRESDRPRQWQYVADRLYPSSGSVAVGLLGLTQPVADADVTALASAMRRSGDMAPRISPNGPVICAEGTDTSELTAAVLLVDASKPLEKVTADCRSIARAVPGPVVVVVDRRNHRP